MDWLQEMDTMSSLFEFTLAEIVEMENLFKQVGEDSLSQDFCEELATSFRCKVGSKVNKKSHQLRSLQSTNLKVLKSLKPMNEPSVVRLDHHAVTVGINEKVKGLSELTFEAKSSKDKAWYDVASFLTYRVMSTGELEVRVRFAGFGKEEDEWVNVKKGVRERSIPLEPSECQKVRVGDLVLCYQEKVQLKRLCCRPT